MTTKIKGVECSLSKIFSAEFEFEIPSFQRPYSWEEEQAEELFDDIYSAYQDQNKDNEYFLGSIVLIKEENKPISKVIDGQQRLTTLTTLLSLISTKVPEEQQVDYSSYIIEPGRASQKISKKVRLQLRKKDQPFFEKYVQNKRFNELFSQEVNFHTEAQEHLTKNAKILEEKLDNTFRSPEEISAFGTFLVNNCYLIAVSTPSEDSAFRIFSVLNNRGMSLLPTDIIKADIIGKIDSTKEEEYNNKWEDVEASLGREEFCNLCNAIRMITRKTKAQYALQEEYRKFVIKDITSLTAINFIDNVLTPYSDAYKAIRHATYQSATKAEEINNLLTWLNRLDYVDWIPVAMFFYVKRKNDSQAFLAFLKKLERLAAYMTIDSKWTFNRRPERFGKIIEELEKNNCENFGKSIELNANEINAFKELLDSDIYTMSSKRRNYILLRLDSFVSDKAAQYDSVKFSIEHVLPQTVSSGSNWEKDWPQIQEREYWVHKLGNLVPLSRSKNSQAQNYDFLAKKEKYFSSKKGVSSFALTSQVISMTSWTPKDVSQRHQSLLDTLCRNWDLGSSANLTSLLPNEEPLIDENITRFYCRSRQANAHGYLLDDKFVLEKGSRITPLPPTDSCHPTTLRRLQEAKASHCLQDNTVLKDIKFSKPSAASSFVMKSSTNGNEQWKSAENIPLGEFRKSNDDKQL